MLDCITEKTYARGVSTGLQESARGSFDRTQTHHAEKGGDVVRGELRAELDPDEEADEERNEGKHQPQGGSDDQDAALIRSSDDE